MTESTKLKFISFIITLAFVIINTIIYPQYLLMNIFVLIYLIIIYKAFAVDAKSHLFFCTIIFAITSESMILPVSKQYGIYYYYITILLYIIIYINDNIKKFSRINLKNKYTIFGIVFYAYLILSIVLSIYKIETVKSIIIYTAMIMFLMMIILQNKTLEDLKKTFKLLLYTFAGVLLLGSMEITGFRYGARNHYTDLGYYVKDYPFLKRIPVVFFYNPNNYALVLVLGMLLLFAYYYTTKSKRTKIFCIILFIDAQINLIFTTSRTAWITLILGLIFASLLFIIKKDNVGFKNLVKCLLLVLVIFITFSFLPGMNAYYGKFNSTPLLRLFNINTALSTKKVSALPIVTGGSGSLSERFTLMLDVVNGVFIKGHIFGFGAGNTIYFIKSLGNTHGVINEHSLWFEILGDFGIFIFAYFVFIYVSILINSIKNFIKESAASKYYFMSACCIFSLVFLVFGPSTVITFPVFWIMLGLSLSLLYNEEEFINNSFSQ